GPPVHGRNGWYLEDLVRRPGTVTGATELLIVEALERLAASGFEFAPLGIAPLRGSDRQMDRRPPAGVRTFRCAVPLCVAQPVQGEVPPERLGGAIRDVPATSPERRPRP